MPAQGQQVGVLLVQLQSAALQTSYLEHPAVRLTLGKQARPLRLAIVDEWCLQQMTAARLDHQPQTPHSHL